MNETENKPEIVIFYNNTKGGTDSFDKKCHDYTVTRKTARWPMRILYGILDQCNVNAYILYSLCSANKLLYRRQFIIDLCTDLVKPMLIQRLTLPTLRLSVRHIITDFVEYEDRPEEQDPRDQLASNIMDKRKRCQLCPSSIDRKTRMFCIRCRKPMCLEHAAKICASCQNLI